MVKRLGLYIFLSLLVTIILINSCNKSLSPVHQVGDRFGGGIVFYVDSTGMHGLISSLYDLTIAGFGPWGLQNPRNSADSTYPYDSSATCNCYISQIITDSGLMAGKNNFDSIQNFFRKNLSYYEDSLGIGLDDASDMCQKLYLNGFHDWFLPTIEAAKEMYKQKKYLGGFSGSVTTHIYYWTSTLLHETANGKGVIYFDFYNGIVSYTCPICNVGLVRPIRQF